MKDLKIIIVLTLVAVLSGASLSYMHQMTYPKIVENQKQQLEKAIFLVLPEAKSYEKLPTGEVPVYKGISAEGDIVGYAFKAVGSGFQGNIIMMVGVNQNLTQIKGMKVLEQVETPGLGAKIALPSFEEQFSGVKVTGHVEYVKNVKPSKENEIQAITGATISSKAVVGIINSTLQQVKELIKG